MRASRAEDAQRCVVSWRGEEKKLLTTKDLFEVVVAGAVVVVLGLIDVCVSCPVVFGTIT